MMTEIPRQARSVAIGAALQAARIITDYYGRVFTIDAKLHNDFVTEVDRKSEEVIIQHILRAFPDHAILAEETGKHRNESPFRWIIDPLDGTTNFIHGMPMFAVSIALEVYGQLAVGVVYEPLRKEMFVAERGKGAFLNDRKIRVSATMEYNRCLLATGFPFKTFDFIGDYLNIFKTFMTQTAGIRRPGSAALDLCYLACGRFDGFWELNLNPWDIAAGTLIIQEAGGRITGFDGQNNFLYKGHVIGSNGILHDWMLSNIQKSLGEKISLL